MIRTTFYPPPSVKKHKKDKFISSESFIRRLLEYKISLYPFGRLFKRSLFDEHVFDLPREIRRGEDYIMNVRLGRKAERIRLIPDVVYHYIQYPESTLHTFKQNWRYETLFDLHLRKSFDAEELSAYQDSLTHAHIRQLLSGLADRGMNAEDPFFRQIIKEADGVTLSRHERWLIAFTKLPYPLRKTIYSALRQIKKSIIRR